MNLVNALQSENKLVDVRGFEPLTPCLQSKRKFNLSRCVGCVYQFEAFLRLLQSCSKKAALHCCGFRKLWRANSGNSGTVCRSRQCLLQIQMTRPPGASIEGDEAATLQDSIQNGGRQTLAGQPLSRAARRLLGVEANRLLFGVQ